MTYIWIPLIILFGALAITLAIYAMVTSGEATVMMFSVVQAPLWYFMVVASRLSPSRSPSRRR